MNNLKTTKGEWTHSKYSNDDLGVYSTSGNGNDIALVRSYKSNEEAEANARLISASPDLYNALNSFVQAIDLCTSERGRKYMQKGRLEAYDAMKKSLTYQEAVRALRKAINP